MPGLHSPDKLLQRKLRARKLGFLKPRVVEGHTAVFVRSEVARNVKTMAKSLEIHSTNQGVPQKLFHSARDSTLAVPMGPAERDYQLLAHRNGNRAKHRVPILTVTSSDASQQEFVWNIDAHTFCPARTICLDDFVRTDELASLYHSALRLIEDQNRTIAFLMNQLQFHDEECRAMGDTATQSSVLSENVTKILDLLSDMDLNNTTTSRSASQPKLNSEAPRNLVRESVPAQTPPVSDEIERRKATIVELRAQTAHHAAVEARRNHLRTHGRVLKTLRVPSGATELQFQISEIFTQFACVSDEIIVTEPYLVSTWQVNNLREFLQAIVTVTHVKTVRINTHVRSICSKDTINTVCDELAAVGLKITTSFVEELHLREMAYSNGVTISSDRGLDIFKAPNAKGVRRCRESTIIYYELSQKELAQQSNIAQNLVAEAKKIMVEEDACEMRRVKALLHVTSEDDKEAKRVKAFRKEVERGHIADAIKGFGYELTDQFTLDSFATECQRTDTDDLDIVSPTAAQGN